MGSGPLITTPAAKDGSSITRRSNAFGAKRDCGCRSGDDANATAPPPRRPTVIADAPNRVWAVDFQFDSTTDGRPIKIVSIVDEHTRECLGGMVERSITGEHLIAELDRLAAERGTYPAVLRCDNGPELACSAMADWVGRSGRSALHPARRAVAQRLCRIVQLPHPRRMPQHQQLLVTGPGPRGHQRLETRLQPPPPALVAGLPTPSPLRCHLYPPMNDSRSPWTSSRGPVNRIETETGWSVKKFVRIARRYRTVKIQAGNQPSPLPTRYPTTSAPLCSKSAPTMRTDRAESGPGVRRGGRNPIDSMPVSRVRGLRPDEPVSTTPTGPNRFVRKRLP